MIVRDDLITYLDNFLDCKRYKDYAPNGLQVEGRFKVEKIQTSVTASKDAILHAINQKADAILVHHGYFWKGESSIIAGIKKERVKLLLDNNINLLAYHLPLDCNQELGNNISLCKRLGLMAIKSHEIDNVSLLWSGELEKALSLDNFAKHIEKVLARKPTVISANNNKIKRIALCTGAAQDLITRAANLGFDTFISGEISERTYYEAKELGINYLACGHHATEMDGIKLLGEHLASKFSLQTEFFDAKNPI